MESIQSKISKILATWAAIGTTIAVLGASGFVTLPDVVVALFSQEFIAQFEVLVNSLLTAYGSAITFVQFFRGYILGKTIDSNSDSASASNVSIIKVLKSSPFAL